MFLLTYLFQNGRLRFALLPVFFFVLTGLSDPASAQTHASMWRSSLNSSYATLVGGDGNGSPLGNYASLEPLGGSVSFKGTLALGDIKQNRLSFLSIAAQGELVDGNLVTAFKNTKLNTSAGISIEYNFRLLRDKAVTFGSAEARYKVDSDVIVAGETAAVNAYSAELAAVAAKLKAVTAQKTMVQNQIQLREQQLVVLDGLIGDAANSFKVRDDAYNEAQKLIAELPKMRRSVDLAQFQLDSLTILAKADKGDLNTHFQRQQRELADGKNAKLQASFSMAEYRFLWVTVIAGAGKKDYYTFDGTKLFPDQLANPNLPTYRLGLALNYYFQDNLTKNAWMLNIGGQVMKDNNIGLLSTQEIIQESVFKNTAGDVTRKVVKKYNAYTDAGKIIDYNQLNVFSNIYYLFAEGTTALHIFPSFFKPKGRHGYVDTGIGLMFSFKDQKKEKAKLNLEAYVVSTDTFGSLGSDNKLWDRNQFGVRVTLPFNRLFK